MAVVELERAGAHLLDLVGHLGQGLLDAVEARVDAAAEDHPVGIGLGHRVLGGDRREPVLVPVEDRHHLGHRHVGQAALEDEVVDLLGGEPVLHVREVGQGLGVTDPGGDVDHRLPRLLALPRQRVLVGRVDDVDHVVEDEDVIDHASLLRSVPSGRCPDAPSLGDFQTNCSVCPKDTVRAAPAQTGRSGPGRRALPGVRPQARRRQPSTSRARGRHQGPRGFRAGRHPRTVPPPRSN